MRGKKLPQEIRDEVIRRVEQGETKHAVARSVGIDPSTVQRWTPHVPVSLIRHDPELKRKFYERVENGEQPSVVAREMNIRDQTGKTWRAHLRGYKNQTAYAAANALPEEVRQKVLEKMKDGITNVEIAKEILIPLDQITVLKRLYLGRSPISATYTDEQREQVLKLIASGTTYAEAKRSIEGLQQTTVKNWHHAAIKAGTAQPYKPNKAKQEDKTFEWIAREYPRLQDWQVPMTEWLKGEKNAMAQKGSALRVFIERYLNGMQLPGTRAEILKRGQLLPDFLQTCCSQSGGGIQKNNYVHDFLDWVLLTDFSDYDEGHTMVSPAYCNPIPWATGAGLPKRTESVREVLPYGFMVQLRERIASGPHFKDWTLAQSLQGRVGYDGSNDGTDWFEVNEDRIDKNDPDCVWRIRKLVNARRDGRSEVLELWSPVRWVALLMKLQLPARTGQVRMADSGESDTWRYDGGIFVANTSPLAQQNKRKPWAQGILRRMPSSDGPDSTILYFNSNKTNDIGRDGTDKGQECPWPHSVELTQDPYYWLEKLRNWQERYNPITKRVAWKDIPAYRGLTIKSDIQNAGYPDTCFLFRTAETVNESHLPVPNSYVDYAWQLLIADFQKQIAENGITHEDGTPILLMDPLKSDRTRFPLHGNRVSLITAFIVDGGIAPELMMKIVGHSRLIMTLYYTKPGYSHLQNALLGAAEKLDAKKDESIVHWLVSSKAESMLDRVVFNADNWQTVIDANPTMRNPVGWYLMHDGICFAGGNTSAGEDIKIRGCHNGGLLVKESRMIYGPVPGGIMNCSLCRWKAVEKRHGPALVATLNNQLYHLRIKQEDAVKHAATVQELKKQKARDEANRTPFGAMKELKTVERLYEMAMERLAILGASIGGTHKLIQRVKALPDSTGDGMALAAVGDVMTMNTVLDEIDSELLQLAGVCGDLAVYPDLGGGKAVYRRSQILDAALKHHSLPPAFAVMSEEDQLIYGNAFMRNLANQANPHNPILGLRTVISIIDQGESLEQVLGVKLTNELASALEQASKGVPIQLNNHLLK